MTMARVEVLSVERRRRWSRSEKERLVAASFEPGVSASEVARSAGIHVSQLFRWRKQLCEVVVSSAPALIPVAIVPEAPALADRAPGEVTSSNGLDRDRVERRAAGPCRSGC